MASEAEATALAASYLGNNNTAEIARYLAAKLVRQVATEEVVASALIRIVENLSSAEDDKEGIQGSIRNQIEMLVKANTEGTPSTSTGGQDALLQLV